MAIAVHCRANGHYLGYLPQRRGFGSGLSLPPWGPDFLIEKDEVESSLCGPFHVIK